MDPTRALLGLAVGAASASFVTTAALRSLRGQSAWSGRSHCDHCGVELGFVSTAPVMSYVLQSGVCRGCGGMIDPAHPIGEAAGACAVGLAALLLDATSAVLASSIALLLLASAVIDARSRRLPNVLTLGVAALGAALAARRGLDQLLLGAAVALACGLALMALRAANRRLGRDPGLGLGDVKLICALGLWLGAAAPWMIAAAAALGLAWRTLRPSTDGRISFGPMLAGAGWTFGLIVEAGGWPGNI